MTTSAKKEVQCWSCGEINTIVFGGESEKGTERCDGCNEVIAEKEVDAITLPSNAEEAKSIKERHGDFTLKEKVKRTLRLS